MSENNKVCVEVADHCIMNVDQSTVSLQEKRENTWTVSVDENKIDVLFNHVSKKKVCVGSIEDVRHDHTCFVSSCRLKNKLNYLIDTANDWSKRLKRSHHKTFMLKGKVNLL